MRSRNFLVLLASTALAITACDDAADLGAGDDIETAQSALVNGPAPPCFSDTPAANQVLIYRDSNFRGDCRALQIGFYPTDGTLSLPHDSVSSFKVGSSVRFRAFRDGTYGGQHNFWTPNASVASLGSWNDAIGSARVEIASRSPYCDDLQEGELALFEDTDYSGDCVVLSTLFSYPTPKDMGIEDDSVSSIVNNSAVLVTLWGDPWYGGPEGISYYPHTRANVVKDSGCFLGVCIHHGMNDRTSSVATSGF